MSRSYNSSPLEFDITDVDSSSKFWSAVFFDISINTRHISSCLPTINGGNARLSNAMLRKENISESTWVAPPGATFFGYASEEPLRLGDFYRVMNSERLNAQMLIPHHPPPIVFPGDLSLLGIYREMALPNDKVLEEFYNDFATVLQIVQKHCSESTRDKLALNAELQFAAMNNDIVRYLYELKLACIRGGDSGEARMKDYEDRMIKPLIYGGGMEALWGGGEGALASYAASFRQGAENSRACGSVRTDAEFVKGFVSGLHPQFDQDKVAIAAHTNLSGAIAAALKCCRNGIDLNMRGWLPSGPTSKVGAKRTVADTNHNQTVATTTAFNPSGSSAPVRAASLRTYTSRGSYSQRDNNPSGNNFVRGGGASSSAAGGASKQVFAVHLNDGSEDIELCLSEGDLDMLSRERETAAEQRGEERAFRLFHMGQSGSGGGRICHQWQHTGECAKKSFKSGDNWIPCYFEHPEVGPNFKPTQGAKSNK
jgi:hypothetical protein